MKKILKLQTLSMNNPTTGGGGGGGAPSNASLLLPCSNSVTSLLLC